MQIVKDPTSGALKIIGALHVSAAEELRRGLRDSLAEGQQLALDLSEVDSCDTACLQLLYATRNSAIRQQKQFSVAAFSSAVLDAGKALGMPLELLATSANSDQVQDTRRGQDGTE